METVKSFVTVIFDSLKSDLSNLRNENNIEVSELRKECNELKRCLEFFQHEIYSLKFECDIYDSKHAQYNDSSAVFIQCYTMDNRIRNVEDWTERKNLCISGVNESVNENTEQKACCSEVSY